MKIEVSVKAGAKKTGVEKQTDGFYIVTVKEPAREGKANEAVVKALAEYFDIPKSAVTLIRGSSARRKLFEICYP